jgi:hypothetical protein
MFPFPDLGPDPIGPWIPYNRGMGVWKMRSTIFVVLISAVLTSCNSQMRSQANTSDGDQTQVSAGLNGVVKARALIPLTAVEGSLSIRALKQLPIKIINLANVRFDISTADFKVPEISNSLLEFGKLSLADLFDNDLRVCGADKKSKCSKAYIQIYTTGTDGPGFYNEEGGYGMPISTNQVKGTPLWVGLEVPNAAVVQTIDLDPKKRVLRLVDFPTPQYELRSDFSEAGAGVYNTTLVIEYGLLQ